MFARGIGEQVDGHAVPLDNGVFAPGHQRGNSESQPVFIKGEGRFQIEGRQFGRDPRQTSHGDHLRMQGNSGDGSVSWSAPRSANPHTKTVMGTPGKGSAP